MMSIEMGVVLGLIVVLAGTRVATVYKYGRTTVKRKKAHGKKKK